MSDTSRNGEIIYQASWNLFDLLWQTTDHLSNRMLSIVQLVGVIIGLSVFGVTTGGLHFGPSRLVGGIGVLFVLIAAGIALCGWRTRPFTTLPAPIEMMRYFEQAGEAKTRDMVLRKLQESVVVASRNADAMATTGFWANVFLLVGFVLLAIGMFLTLALDP